MTFETPKPRLTIVMGSAGSGKTQWLQERFQQSLGHALLVVASDGEAELVRAELARRTGYPIADFKTNIVPFRRFVHEIATLHLTESSRILSTPFQRLLVEDICDKTLHPEGFLGQMRGSSGFVSELIARFREWKLACITPNALRESAERLKTAGERETFIRKTEEFARLFGAYEHFLRSNGLTDSEDQLHYATRRLEERLVLPGSPKLVLVDGFFRLNRAQIKFLQAVAGQSSGVELVVTLPFDTSRPLLFSASERTLHTLRQEFDTQEISLEANRSLSPLSYLESQLFATPQEPEPLPPVRVHNPILLFDAPNNYVEAEMVAREFRRLFDNGGCRWDDFKIVLRTQGEYAPILSSVFERYEIPLGVDGAERLGENPLLKTVMALFRIVLEGWQREDVLAFLKSSYTLPDKLEADALRKMARSQRVREGREKWLGLVGEEENGYASIRSTFERIMVFEESLHRAYASPVFFVERVRSAIEIFGLLEQIEHGETLRAVRDRAVWKVADEVLDALAQMTLLGGRSAVTAKEFFDALVMAWESASALAVEEEGRVRVVEPYETRQFPARFVAVMGLTERVFPRRITEDPFFRDSERIVLRRVSGFDLEEQRGRTDDERLLFYFAVTAPREQLILSFPRTSDESDALPSFYLDEVRSLFSRGWQEHLVTVSRTLADVAPRSEEVVSDADRLLSACANLFDPTGSTREELRRCQEGAIVLLRQALEGDKAGGTCVLRSRCEPSLPKIKDPGLREAFSLGKSVYSVSELEAFRRCPFQYLMRYVWRLNSDDEVGHLRAQGTLLHTVLRRYFRGKKASGASVPTEQETLVAELRKVLEEVLAEEELDDVSHRVAMIGRMLWDALEGFAERETRFAPLFKMVPQYFELAFGMELGNRTGGEDEDRAGTDSIELDNASRREALELTGRENDRTVKVCGVVDRVDMDTAGGYALAMDYKLGNAPEPGAMVQGESLQLPLYLLALERVFGLTAGVGCYDAVHQPGRPRLYMPHIAPPAQFRPVSGEAGATVKALNRTQFEELMRTAETAAVDVVTEIGQAQVTAKPGKHCGICAYKDVCRTTLAGGHDGEENRGLSERV